MIMIYYEIYIEKVRSVRAILSRALNLLLGAGMDITGTNMCGDYIYSGHTSILTSTTLFILEYTPQVPMY